MGNLMAKAPVDDAASKDPTQQIKVRWKSDQLKSSYANFCNATSTREEVVLNFGVNHNWESAAERFITTLQGR